MKLLRLGCSLVRIFCSFLRVLLILQGLDAETYANDLIKTRIVRIGLEISLVSVM